jgi:1-acyl-sn-glycerol-3-phosphate acyltransferase
MRRSSSRGTEPGGGLLRWTRGVLGSACVAPWTALVTTSAVSLARLTDDPRWVARGERLWAAGLLGAWGVRVRVESATEVEVGRPYVVMSNHCSHADVAILFVALPFVPGFLAKQELARVPFLATALHAGGHVLVDRSDGASGIRAIQSVAREVQAGKTVAIFPEGTRGDGGALLPFKKGAFVIAKRAEAAILPVGIQGSHAVLPRGEILPRPSDVSVRIGEAISPAEIAVSSAEQLLQQVRARIADLSGLRPAPPATGRVVSRAPAPA